MADREELTQRMEKLVRRMAAAEAGVHNVLPDYHEARSIVSDLPKPVDPIDPDLIEAREICASRDGVDAGQANAFRNGSFDVGSNVPLVFAGIKRGRTLAAGGTAAKGDDLHP